MGSTAVARNKQEARIYTYLLGVEPAALPGPLSVYQSTVATMEDTFRLVNSLLGRDQADAGDFAPAGGTTHLSRSIALPATTPRIWPDV